MCWVLFVVVRSVCSLFLVVVWYMSRGNLVFVVCSLFCFGECRCVFFFCLVLVVDRYVLCVVVGVVCWLCVAC